MHKYKIINSPENKSGVADTNGTIVVPLEYDSIKQIIDDKWVVVANWHQYFEDKSDEYENVRTFRRKYRYGLVDLQNNIYFKPQNDMLWVRKDIVYIMNDGIVNECDIEGRYIWHTFGKKIFLKDRIVFQRDNFAITRKYVTAQDVYESYTQYTVYDNNLNVLDKLRCGYSCKYPHAEFEKFLEKQISERIRKKKVVNICPEFNIWGWDNIHLTYYSDIKSELIDKYHRYYKFDVEINGIEFNDVVNPSELIVNSLFIHILCRIDDTDGKYYHYVLNDKGHLLYECEGSLSIGKMGKNVTNLLLINGRFVLDSEGNKHQLEDCCQERFNYSADGNGFILIADEQSRFGVMNTYGRLIVPQVFESPEFLRDEIYCYGNQYQYDDPMDAYENDYDALWNTD